MFDVATTNNSVSKYFFIIVKKRRNCFIAFPHFWYRQAPHSMKSVSSSRPVKVREPVIACSLLFLKLAVSKCENKDC